MPSDGAEAGNATIKAMVGSARSGYSRDKIRACSIGGGWGEKVTGYLD